MRCFPSRLNSRNNVRLSFMSDRDPLELSNTNPSGAGLCSICGHRHSQEDSCIEFEPARESQNSDELVGKTVGGKYQIISRLGEGGMSVVYKAKQFPINKIVALKMLLAHLSGDQKSSARFLQEAKAAGQFSHPNIVAVLDYGLDEKNRPFLVMDYLEGKSLSEVLKERNWLPYKEALPLFMEICDGLAAAHENGVIHRDIKPSNIVLQNLPAGGSRVRIVDFGIAKMLDAESQHLTKTGEVFGSPLYMSPEQCESSKIDRRSDIYSLGVVFYETLSGKRPIVGQSALETMHLHMKELPPSLQKVSEGQSIPLSLENIVFKMMAKDKEKRHSSMLELKNELEEFSRGESKELSGNISYFGREISRKSKLITASIASVLALAIAGSILYPHACLAIAQKQFEEANHEFALNEFNRAEPLIKSAVKLSKHSGDKSFESRALGLLIKVYAKQGNVDDLNNARNQRQGLIKEILAKCEIGDEPIDDLLRKLPGNPDAGNLVLANQTEIKVRTSRKQSHNRLKASMTQEPKSRAASSTTAYGGAGGGVHGSIFGVTIADTKQESAPSSPPPPPLPLASLALSPSPAPLPSPSPAPLPATYPSPQKASSVLAGSLSARKPSSAPSPVRSQGFNQNRDGARRSGWSSGPISIPETKEESSKKKAFRKFIEIVDERPTLASVASAATDSGASNSGASELRTTRRSFDDHQLVAEELLDPELLDKLEAACDYLIEKQEFSKASQCASRALNAVMAYKHASHGANNLYESNQELSKLYTRIAYSEIMLSNFKNSPETVDGIARAIKLASLGNYKTEELEARAVYYFLYMKQGNRGRAESEFKNLLAKADTLSLESPILKQIRKQMEL